MHPLEFDHGKNRLFFSYGSLITWDGQVHKDALWLVSPSQTLAPISRYTQRIHDRIDHDQCRSTRIDTQAIPDETWDVYIRAEIRSTTICQ